MRLLETFGGIVIWSTFDIYEIWVYWNKSSLSTFFKSLSREKSTQHEKVRFIKRNKLKLTQVELLSFLIFKNVNEGILLLKIPLRSNDRKYMFHSCDYFLKIFYYFHYSAFKFVFVNNKFKSKLLKHCNCFRK